MKSSDLNWIAGILDKGCALSGMVPQNGTAYLRLIVSSTNMEVAMKLHALLGTGSIKITTRESMIRYHGLKKSQSKIKHSFRYCLYGSNAAKLLEQVMPYFRTERMQKRARLAIQLDKDRSDKTLAKLRKLGTRTIKT
jgi:hypothetical protein